MQESGAAGYGGAEERAQKELAAGEPAHRVTISTGELLRASLRRNKLSRSQCETVMPSAHIAAFTTSITHARRLTAR